MVHERDFSVPLADNDPHQLEVGNYQWRADEPGKFSVVPTKGTAKKHNIRLKVSNKFLKSQGNSQES